MRNLSGTAAFPNAAAAEKFRAEQNAKRMAKNEDAESEKEVEA